MSTENNDNTDTVATDPGPEPPAKKTKTEPAQKIPQNVQDIDRYTLGCIIQLQTLQIMAQDPEMRSSMRADKDNEQMQQFTVLYDHLAAIFRAPADDA
jgi:hypothetical protein